jgi:hypothetical protein
MKIITTSTEDAEQIAAIISEANKDIAKQFNINKDNNPKHPSFYTKEWVLSDFTRGEKYFIHKNNNIITGCVAFEQPNADTAYPSYQHWNNSSA